MYFINHKQIDERLAFIGSIAQACEQIAGQWPGEETESLILQLAQERALHLAIESVTDIGSLLIDAFILRDASSYEDIVEILHDEQALDSALAEQLLQLVRLRKPIVQEYTSWERSRLHPLTASLPAALRQFVACIAAFMNKELS